MRSNIDKALPNRTAHPNTSDEGSDHALTFREVPRPKTSVDVNKVTNHRLVNMLSSTPSSERCCLNVGQWRRNNLSREKKHRSNLSSPWHHSPCTDKHQVRVGRGKASGGYSSPSGQDKQYQQINRRRTKLGRPPSYVGVTKCRATSVLRGR